jgi:hypothetical protein
MMSFLRSAISEVVHLSVDDGWLALALVVWCAAVGVGVAFWTPSIALPGPTLFVGCVVILVANVARAARAHSRGAEQ